ncbi:unnamed protein product, partial [Prorocentrum cordatum]
DSLDAPTTIATWRRRDRPGGSLDPLDPAAHEELNLLLKDIGMDGDVPEIGSLISTNGLCDDPQPAGQERLASGRSPPRGQCPADAGGRGWPRWAASRACSTGCTSEPPPRPARPPAVAPSPTEPR